jgi:branched-chain amino acid transport system substrate-binding protein
MGGRKTMRSRWVSGIALGAILVAGCGGNAEDATGDGTEPAPTTEAPGDATEPDTSGEVAQGVTDSEIHIAAFGPLTGAASWLGLGNRDGFQMALEEINEGGGIHGRQLRLTFEDDAYEVAQAQQVVRRIIDQEKPFLIYGGTGSTVFLSVADRLRESGLPVFNGFSGSEAARTDTEVAGMWHGEAVSTKWVIPTYLDLVEELGVERIGLIHDVGEWGRALCEPIIEQLTDMGVAPTTVQTYAVGDTDFTGQLTAIRQTDPQIVVNCGHYPEATIMIQQAAELGIDVPFIGDTAQANASVWESAGDAADNFMFGWYSPQFLTEETGAMGEFREKFAARYPDAPAGRPNHADTFSYGAAYLIAEALDQAGPDLTAEAFNEAMANISGFQATPINQEADCANERHECFTDVYWVRVVDGVASTVDDADWAELREAIGTAG